MLGFNFVNNNMCVCDDERQDYGILGCDAMYEQCDRWVRTFQRNLTPPSSGQEIYVCNCFQRRSDVKMKAAGSSKSLVPIYQGIRCHIQVDSNLDLYHWLILSATGVTAPRSARFLPMIFSVNTILKRML